MASEVGICNKALSRLGIDQLIESLDDPNSRARQCKLHYAETRDEVLADFPWNFAQSVVALSPVSGVEVPGWGYVYRYPTDCLQAHVVTDEVGARVPVGAAWLSCDVWNYDAQFPVDARMPFRVMADPVTSGAKILVTDVEAAYLWFTKRVTDPNQMSALFRSALAWKLATEIALGVKADGRLHQNAIEKYVWTVSQGQAHSLNEERPDRPRVSPSIAARR